MLLMAVNTPYQAEVFRVRPKDFFPQVEVAGCYILYKDKYLFLYRSLGKPQECTWGVPAGKMEKGETPFQTVNREVFEEVGVELDKDLLKSTAPLYVRYPHMDFIYHMFTQEFLDLPEIRLSDEHQDYAWISLEEAQNMPLISGGIEAFYHFLALERQPKLERKGFYFIRHGQTDVNANPHIKRADYDLPLNTKGKEQAHLAKHVVSNLCLNSVCHSPIQRAVETKDILKEVLAIEHHEDEFLSECKADIWMKMVRLERGRGYRVCSEVKSFLTKAITGVSKALEKNGPVLIVAHGGVHWAICYHLMIEDHPWKIGNCEVVHFEPIDELKWRARVIQ